MGGGTHIDGDGHEVIIKPDRDPPRKLWDVIANKMVPFELASPDREPRFGVGSGPLARGI